MSLSDRDRELAKKHIEHGFVWNGQLIFTKKSLAAFLAERDALAIKEKDDAVRDVLMDCISALETCGKDYDYVLGKARRLLDTKPSQT